jgi:hypothetical protein
MADLGGIVAEVAPDIGEAHMRFLTELHCHTAETSECSKLQGEELVNQYRAKGFHAIVVTDHYHHIFFHNGLDGFTWNEKVDKFFFCYRTAKHYYYRVGFNVILGMELRFTEDSNDYLIYGFDEQFLYDYPELYDYTLERFREFADTHHLLFIQTHPFRRGMVVINYDLLDGIEIYNAHPRHLYSNPLAEFCYQEQSKKRSFIATVGGDCHRAPSVGLAGIMTDILPENSFDIVTILRSGDYQIFRADNDLKT